MRGGGEKGRERKGGEGEVGRGRADKGNSEGVTHVKFAYWVSSAHLASISV